MKSLLSSPMTAMSAPVGTLFKSFLSSSSAYCPEGPVLCPLPSETSPSPEMRIRCPRLTTHPEFVHPLDVLSAVTFTFKTIGLIDDLVGDVFSGGSFLVFVCCTGG